MPKTSKKTKASKGTGLKKRFDLKNRKVQFFVTIAIVALLGGGWFTYKSFAAAIYDLDAYSKFSCHTSPCKVISDGGKNTYVYQISGTNLDSGGALFGKIQTKGSYQFDSGAKYRLCVTAKGIGGTPHIFLVYPNSETGYNYRWEGQQQVYYLNNDTYGKYCYTYIMENNSSPYAKIQIAHADPNAGPFAHAKISRLTVEKIVAGTGHPTGCTGKNC